MEPKVILLIEDNPSDIELTRRALLKSNIANPLTVVEDGQDALDYFFKKGKYKTDLPYDYPAITLLDLKLPRVDGIEVLRQLRANPRTKRVPIVVLTSSNEERDLAACYDLGVNSYIRKPVSFEQFADCIRQLGLYWLVLNEVPPVVKD
jgi:two-component system, response regulator